MFELRVIVQWAPLGSATFQFVRVLLEEAIEYVGVEARLVTGQSCVEGAPVRRDRLGPVLLHVEARETVVALG